MDSATSGQPSALLPPELLQHIFSLITYERPIVRYRAMRSSRSFEPQLSFAHVCRAWRSAALGSQHWPGVRLSLRSAESLKEGIDHDNGQALLHVHIDTKHYHTDIPPYRCQGCRPLPALEQLSRVRTLFLKAHNKDYSGTDIRENVETYARALEDRPAHELQDLTFEWQFDQRLEVEFKHPFPRLRYLALLGCATKGGRPLPSILRTKNLVHINFWDVSLFENIDALVDTFSGWQHLEYASLTKCKIISSPDDSRMITKYARCTVYLHSLKELNLSASANDIGSFLTYIAFPPTSRAEIYTIASTPDSTPIIVDAIHDHFDSNEGRSVFANAHSFVISYPDGFEILSSVLKVSVYTPFQITDARPEARFLFHQSESDSQVSFFEAHIARLPAIETVNRLDLSMSDFFGSHRPPARVLRRFVGVTRLVLSETSQSVLDDIAKETDGTPLFPQLEWLELLEIVFQGQEVADICELLKQVREARPSLVRLVLRECYLNNEETEIFRSVFGQDNVEIEHNEEALNA
ncbi:hypothetical protein PENSPDRAFT_655139 [Peniophora sp. CONT]|nr:hypothetical protein PENSPDRAFT_655139 [Peniophora sp. CONT]